jgi:ADP-L-glycero-D-manno-heptose 6-epimerase
MIVVTGAAGFIASCLIAKLNQDGYRSIVAVDDFSRKDKEANLAGKDIIAYVDRTVFPHWLRENGMETEFVFHLGARTDTTETSTEIFDRLNLNYSKEVWSICTEFQIPLIYASSAATYGAGESGYDDDHSTIPLLKPLNPYAHSKQDFDIWVLSQKESPFFWAGLKFFNVYGPNENHKGRMASVIFHAFRQIKEDGKMSLFQSHREGIADGHQMRDFVYVKDVTEVCFWLMHHRKNSGIFNLGSGKARTFLDLAKATFAAMKLEEKIYFVPTPAEIRDSYQYFTEAEMEKLKNAGYPHPFTSLEDGIKDYVTTYLIPEQYQ